MAILMVAFLLPVGLSNMAGGPNRVRTLGKTAAGDKLTTEDIQKAEGDIKLIGILQTLRSPKMDGFMALEGLARQNGPNHADPREVYALLLKEAKRSGMIARDADVDELLTGGGDAKDQDATKQYVFGQLKAEKIKTETFYAAVRNWLMIDKYFNASAPSVPPSDPELREIFRDFNEKLKVRVAIIPADKFAKSVTEPTAEEIDKQFNDFRTLRPGEFNASSQMGFGYAQPDRVQVQYLAMNELPIVRAMVPSDESVREYYRANKSQFAKPDLDDKGSPIQGSGKPVDFAQAKPEIIAKLSKEMADNKMDELLSQLQQSLSSATSQPAGVNPYAAVVNKMIDTTPPVLDKKIDVQIDQPLDKAIESVAQAAGLKVIVFPYGGTGKTMLSPSVHVNLVMSKARLGDVLAAITGQVKWQPIKWATLSGFDGDLFPLSVGADAASGAGGDTSFFPLVAGDSGAVSSEQMFSNPILGHAVTSASGQDSLMMRAFISEPLLKGREFAGAMKVGAQGPRMYIVAETSMGRGELAGRLLWTLASAVPGYEPTAMDDQIRQQVVKDLKQRAAFDKAMDAAKALEAKVQQGQDLAALAKAQDLDVQDSGYIARMEENYGKQPAPGKVPGMESEEALASRVPGANYKDLAQQVVKETFALVPKPGQQATTSPATIAPATQSQPSTMPAASGVVIVPMRWSNQVALVQRLDYRPAVLGKYLEPAAGGLGFFPFEIDRKTLKDWKAGQERRISEAVWFGYSAVKGRTGYTPEAQEK
jgi:hypothetical protein